MAIGDPPGRPEPEPILPSVAAASPTVVEAPAPGLASPRLTRAPAGSNGHGHLSDLEPLLPDDDHLATIPIEDPELVYDRLARSQRSRVLKHTPRAAAATAAKPASSASPVPRRVRASTPSSVPASLANLIETRTQLKARAAIDGLTPIVSGLLAVGEIALWHGMPRSMKSIVLLRTLIDLAVGDAPALGHPAFLVSRAYRCLYFTEEDSAQLIDSRYDLVAFGRPDTLRDAEFPNLGLVVRRGLDFDSQEGRDGILAQIRNHQAEVVAFDPLRGFTGNCDKGPSDLRPVVSFLRYIQRETTAKTLILAHHDTKPPRDGVDNRERAHKASGGGIFSIADCPTHFERADQEGMVTFCFPNSYKARQAPAPFSVAIDTVDAAWTFRVADTTAHAIPDFRIVEFVRQNPGCTLRQIRDGVVGDSQKIGSRIHSLVKLGSLIQLEGARRALYHYLPDDAPKEDPPQTTPTPAESGA